MKALFESEGISGYVYHGSIRNELANDGTVAINEKLDCVRCHPRPRINPIVTRLREAVYAAPFWTELQSLVSAVDRAFEHRAITQRQTENLALTIAERSRLRGAARVSRKTR